MTDELIDAYDEDGGGSSPQERDWKGMASALLVILIISSIIGATIIFATPLGSIGHVEEGIDFNELRHSDQHFIQNSWWISDNEIVYHVPRKGANIYNTLTHNMTRVADSLFTANSLNESAISYSSNVAYTAQKLVRPDASRNPDRVTFSMTIINNDNGRKYPVGASLTRKDEILAFKWSENGHSYAFVYNDNVYYVKTPEEDAILVTNQEEPGILHGTFDWVYNEEIYERNSAEGGAMWFSPSNQYLAYASRPVKSSREVIMTTFGRGESYEYQYGMEYPKTGEKKIAVFTISIWNTHTKKAATMDVQLRDSTSFHYLFAVSWVTLHGKEVLLTTWANRWQNETAITLCSYEKATCSLIYEHKYDHAQWATPKDYENMIHSNSSFFFLLPKSKKGNAYQHIAKIELTPDLRLSSINFLPSGEYDIVEILQYRPQEDVVFYAARAPNPWESHTYTTPAGTRSILREDHCVSCVFSNCTDQGKTTISKGDQPKVDFSCFGPGQYYQAMISLNETLKPQEMQIITEPSTKELKIPKWKIEKYNLSSGYEAIVQIYEGDQKAHSIPVLLNVYGGPDSNQVVDKLYAEPRPIGYGNHAIIHIDVRGSGGRGWKYRSPIYGRLVTVEVEDTLDAMNQILAKYPKFDRTRVSVFGWSYGGTMAARLVEMAPDYFFKCAISVAPVTNFIYYDATYTERYMGDTPKSEYTDLTVDVHKFKYTKLLLVHGLRDDNVHFQNSALLMESLQKQAIPFQLMVYPNEAHGLSLVHEHVSSLFQSFLSTCYN